MSTERGWAGVVVRVIVVATLLVVLGAYLRVALPALAYPYGLEWMEGGSVDVVARVVAGKPIYAPASLEYVPYIYAPLYYVVAAGASWVVGVGFLAPRLVSFLSVLATLWLIANFVRREADAWWPGIVAATLYLACYELCGRWFHLARVDSLFVLGLVAASYLLRGPSTRARDVACGVVLAAVVLTKQTGVVALAPLGVWLLVTDRRRGLAVGGTAIALLAIVVGIWQVTSDGAFWRYVWHIPNSHPLTPEHVFGFWITDMRTALPLCFVAAGSVVPIAGATRGDRSFFAAMLLGWIGSAWLARLHSGGALNALMPAAAALAITTGIVITRGRTYFEKRQLASRAAVVGAALLVLEVWLLGLPDPSGRPGADARERGDRFLAYLRSLPGDVLLPDHRFVQTRAGKTSYGLGMAAADLLRSDAVPTERRSLESEIDAALSNHRFSHVLLTVRGGWISTRVMKHYCLARTIDLAPVPVAGAPHRPRWVYVPRGSPACRRRK